MVQGPEMFAQHGRVVLVMLKDGRQLEGELLRMTECWVIGDDRFYDYEIDSIEDVD